MSFGATGKQMIGYDTRDVLCPSGCNICLSLVGFRHDGFASKGPTTVLLPCKPFETEQLAIIGHESSYAIRPKTCLRPTDLHQGSSPSLYKTGTSPSYSTISTFDPFQPPHSAYHIWLDPLNTVSSKASFKSSLRRIIPTNVSNPWLTSTVC